RGDSARHILESVVFNDTEGRTRIAARTVLEDIRLDKLTQDFRLLNNSHDLDLERACFILAQIEYPNLDVPRYRNTIDQLAEEAAQRICRLEDDREKVDVINHFIFDEKRFRGNVRSYYEPENSYINKVLDRRVGIPISLSAIYLFIARRLALPVYGVGFPGHFLLKYHRESQVFFIDAFNGGQVLTQQDCRGFLRKMGYAFQPYYLNTSGSRDILARMIRNLVLIYIQKNQQNKIDTLEKIFSDFVMN
ncbi:MAG: SirB1 family protein, partial [bacterium]